MNQRVIIYREGLRGSMVAGFWDLLLDETLVQGTLIVPAACVERIGTYNHRLPAKRWYEYVLRLSQTYEVILTGLWEEIYDTYNCDLIGTETLNEDAVAVDCYILARYRVQLQQGGVFDDAVESILAEADSIGITQQAIAWMEEMLQEKGRYGYYDRGSQPFLIYKGDTVCYNILTVFAEQIGEALQRQGYIVEYFDLSKEEIADTCRLVGRQYQAVIGIQSYMFSVKLRDGRGFLHDYIQGPKYNFIFDHPAHMRNHLAETPKDLTILTVDRDYAEYAKRTYPVKAYFLPPGGIVQNHEERERIYDLVFIGSYFDNLSFVRVQYQSWSRSDRRLANRFMLNLRRYPSDIAEMSLTKAMKQLGWQSSWELVAGYLHQFRDLVVCVSTYYRVKVLRTLVEAGIPIHVFGKSWENCKLRMNPAFLWHDQDLTTDECLDVWSRSRLTLNIMSWHKDAITERILNAMLQKSVVVTETNPYMKESFEDGEDVILYRLDDLGTMVKRITEVLRDSERSWRIAEQGYQRARASHTWDDRAEQLVTIIQKDDANLK